MKIDGTKCKKALWKLCDQIEKAILQTVEEAADAAFKSAKETRSYNNRTWLLRTSTRRYSTPGTIYVEAGASYAAYLEYGTRFIAPRQFMATGLSKGRAVIDQRLTKRVDKLIGRFNG